LKIRLSLFVAALLISLPALAQQTGSISGRVTSATGEGLPGVTIEANGNVLPRARIATTSSTGEYRLQLLPPGDYVLTYSLSGLTPEMRNLKVLLDQNSVVNIALGISEQLEVVAALPAIDTSSAEIKTAIDNEVIDQLPVGQEYRDLVKLIPGVQYSEDSVRGPSAGGSGQDNVYLFDGVNVGLPLFGTLSADPSSHDIDQVSIVKGGALATDFNRSGGFTINSVSKSGTSQFRGAVSYQIQTEGMTADRKTLSSEEFDSDRDWAVFSIGGPLVSERLFFYSSYYRPTEDRENRSNLYGEVPNAESTRDEFFAKLTFTPTDSILLNGSYRTSEKDETGEGITEDTFAGSVSVGNESTLDISILEGTWVVNDRSFLNFKATSFENDTTSRPDNLFGFSIASDGSLGLDVANLDQQGLFLVPQPLDGEDAYNAFITPLISRYGYLENGVLNGGGRVGGGSRIDDTDFARESFQIGYDYLLGKHELHLGYQMSKDEEDLSRTSNGWGVISVPGGRSTFNDIPVFYEARFEQQGLVNEAGQITPVIHSEFQSVSFEINDTIRLANWTLNLGVIVSNDELFGQGLRENDSNVSGFELAPGNKYKMYEVDFDEMIQPRLGLTRSLNEGRASAYASYSRYHPAASSLPRAASWARNLRRSIRGFFDANGNLIGTDPVRSSSGKFFADDLDPRFIDEFVIGYSKQLSNTWSLKTHARYRYGSNFWEDTNNNARSRFNPPAGIPQEDYIPELASFRAEVGGSSYVIAELDNAFTKYWEASAEAEYRGKKAYFRGSYVWSHYYGNFDQDNSTTANDANTFIGSSFIADGAGRQLWNFREGNLRGDRRHQLKVYGFYNLKWNASLGAFAVIQSGQPWEIWDVEVYRDLTGSSSDTSRFAEPAGSRTTSAHYQLDLNYTHNFPLGDRYNVQLRVDLFNVTDQQTGYNIQNKRNSSNSRDPRSFYNPQRFQVAVKFEF
jgi:hypothetical protein